MAYRSCNCEEEEQIRRVWLSRISYLVEDILIILADPMIQVGNVNSSINFIINVKSLQTIFLHIMATCFEFWNLPTVV